MAAQRRPRQPRAPAGLLARAATQALAVGAVALSRLRIARLRSHHAIAARYRMVARRHRPGAQRRGRHRRPARGAGLRPPVEELVAAWRHARGGAVAGRGHWRPGAARHGLGLAHRRGRGGSAVLHAVHAGRHGAVHAHHGSVVAAQSRHRLHAANERESLLRDAADLGRHHAGRPHRLRRRGRRGGRAGGMRPIGRRALGSREAT